MSEENVKLPVWFWVVGGLILAWNLMGLMHFMQQMTMTDASIMELPENQRILFQNIPIWTKIAFGIAIFGGLGGAIALMMRNKLASPLFLVSMVGILVQMSQSFMIMDKMDAEISKHVLIMTCMIIGFGVLAIWFSRYCTQKNWLR